MGAVIIILVFHTDVQSMLRQLATLGVASSAIFAQPSVNPISVECNGDNTIDVSIDYDQKAEILSFEYGSCTKDNVGRANLTQQADFGWKFTLDVDLCNMNDKLRTLQYNQTMSVRVGKKSQTMELTLANFQIDSYCTYTSSYKVKFDYGNLEAETISYSKDAGLVNLTFAIKSYNANFSTEEANSKQAGEIVNLGLSVTSDNFNHAEDIATSKTGKVFAPKKCVVSDNNAQTYTLFDSEDNCQNKDIDFSIDFAQEKNMWQFSHILFLLGDYRTSKLSLSCDVIVCDKQKSDDCDAVVKSCLKSVDAVKSWGQWSNCTKECGGGERNRSATCVKEKFFGAACGDLEETEVCNNQTCAPKYCKNKDDGIVFKMRKDGSTSEKSNCWTFLGEMLRLSGLILEQFKEIVKDGCEKNFNQLSSHFQTNTNVELFEISDDGDNLLDYDSFGLLKICQAECAYAGTNPDGCVIETR